MHKHTEETHYPQGIAGYAVIGIYTGSNNAPPWVGPIKPTRKEAADAYYVRACEYAGINPDAFPVSGAWQEELIDAKIELEERQDSIVFETGDEHLFMVKVPL